MAEKQYIVVTPLKLAGAKKGEFERAQPGKTVTLDETVAAPLIKCGAIREPEVIEQEAAKK